MSQSTDSRLDFLSADEKQNYFEKIQGRTILDHPDLKRLYCMANYSLRKDMSVRGYLAVLDPTAKIDASMLPRSMFESLSTYELKNVHKLEEAEAIKSRLEQFSKSFKYGDYFHSSLSKFDDKTGEEKCKWVGSLANEDSMVAICERKKDRNSMPSFYLVVRSSIPTVIEELKQMIGGKKKINIGKQMDRARAISRRNCDKIAWQIAQEMQLDIDTQLDLVPAVQSEYRSHPIIGKATHHQFQSDIRKIDIPNGNRVKSFLGYFNDVTYPEIGDQKVLISEGPHLGFTEFSLEGKTTLPLGVPVTTVRLASGSSPISDLDSGDHQKKLIEFQNEHWYWPSNAVFHEDLHQNAYRPIDTAFVDHLYRISIDVDNPRHFYRPIVGALGY